MLSHTVCTCRRVYPAHAAGMGRLSTASLSQSQFVPREQEGKLLALSEPQQGGGRLGPVCSHSMCFGVSRTTFPGTRATLGLYTAPIWPAGS